MMYYAMDGAWKRGAVELDAVDDIDQYQFLRSEMIPTAPIRLRHATGRHWCDLVSSSCCDLLSNRVFQAFEDCSATGWKAFPVDIRNKKSEVVSGYAAISVTGRAGPLDPSLSQRQWFEPPVPEGKGHWGLKGCLFQPDTWDGSDVFIPGITSFVFVTEKVKRAVEGIGVSNIE
jgi:hypothetical protein